MPRLSDSMEEGTILKWLKGDGDEVSRGDELVEIETDKANMTYEADQDGVLAIVAKEGDTLAVGEVIARIGEGGDGGGAAAQEEPAAEEEEPGGEEDEPAAEEEEPGGEEDEEPAAEEDEHAAPDGDGDGDDQQPAREEKAPARAERAESGGDRANGAGDGRVKASPVARRMAREKGLELEGLSGTGPGGRIVKADVEAAAREGGAATATEAPADGDGDGDAPPKRADRPRAPADGGRAKGEVQVEELSRTQQVIARRMAESRATVPDFQVQVDVDMEGAVSLRKRLKEMSGDRPAPTYNDMVVKASALALRDFPRANGAYRDGHFELYSRVNVGVAVAAHDALVVPTVFDADTKSLGEIAHETHELAERVREGKVTPPELSGGTFTVSNLGMYGVTRFTAVINRPQAAILSVGSLEQRPVVHEGEIVARHTMGLILACDHRILYGADAAQFLARIRELLEEPLAMAL